MHASAENNCCPSRLLAMAVANSMSLSRDVDLVQRSQMEQEHRNPLFNISGVHTDLSAFFVTILFSRVGFSPFCAVFSSPSLKRVCFTFIERHLRLLACRKKSKPPGAVIGERFFTGSTPWVDAAVGALFCDMKTRILQRLPQGYEREETIHRCIVRFRWAENPMTFAKSSN